MAPINHIHCPTFAVWLLHYVKFEEHKVVQEKDLKMTRRLVV